MSGHSKWSSIKHKKGAADAKRGQLFTKLTRALIVAAREGGPDPAANLALAERDREGARCVDAEGQHRACDRARRWRGRRCRGVRAHRLRGLRRPEGVAVFAEALTDNRNRTAGEVRNIFAKHDGNLAESGRSRGCSSARA